MSEGADAAGAYRRMMEREEAVDAAIGKVVRAAVMLELEVSRIYVAVEGSTSLAYAWSQGRTVDSLVKATRKSGGMARLDGLTTSRLRLTLTRTRQLLELRNAVVHGVWAIDADAAKADTYLTHRPRIGKFSPDVASWDESKLLDLAVNLYKTARQAWDVSTNALIPGSPWDAWEE